MNAFIHLAVGCWLAFLTAQLSAQTLHTLNDIQRDVKLHSIESSDSWNFILAGQETTLSAERIVRWGAWSGVLNDQAVWLSDDSFVCGQVELNASGVTLGNDWLQVPSLPWKAIRGVVLAPPRTLDNWLALQAQMQSRSGEEDIVWLVDGKRLSGIVRVDGAQDVRGEQSIHVDSSGQNISLRLADIQAIVFSPALLGPVPEHRGSIQLSLIDGSRLWTLQIGPSPPGIGLTLDSGLQLQSIDQTSVFAGSISGVARPSATTTFLSDLSPARYRHLPDSTLRWELGTDRDVLGAALHTEHSIFLRGLATHSSSQVAYRWDGSPVRLLAEVTLAAAPPNSAERLGSVACQVLVARDGELQTVHSFSLQRAAEGAVQPLEILDLDLRDAKLIVLVTDKADYGQYGDQVLWLDARLAPDLRPTH
ncbi:MAG: NPCBM/NEW2 domain-containing protein [Aureliella sp.]